MAFGSKAFGASYFAEPSVLLVGEPGFVTGTDLAATAGSLSTIAVSAGEGRTVYVAAGQIDDLAETASTIKSIGAALAEILDEEGGYPP